MRPRRALLPALLATGLLVTACGGDDAAPEGDAAATDASSEVDPDAEGADGDGDVRTVAHDRGETEVPADPARVVVLDSPHLDTALALGVTPVGAAEAASGEGLPAYLGAEAEGIEVVGSIEEPDLEAIATLEPDLIVSATVRHDGIYDQLSAIAPTVFSADSGTNWREGFAVASDALGVPEEGEAALAEHDARVTEVGEAVGAADLDAAIVRFLPGEIRVYGPETFSGSVLTDVGFTLPDEDYDEYSMAYLSGEQLPRVGDVDVLFATTYGAPEDSALAEVGPLWDNLPVVQDGQQFDVEDDEWMIGIGLLGADIVLDDVESLLTDGA